MNNLIKYAAASAAAACFALTNVQAEELSRFADTEGHWASAYIDTLAELGAVDGMEDGLFHPEETVTNAQLVTILIRTRYGEMIPINDDWYSGYMDFALKNGIITDLETEFPNDAITRQSTARIVHEMLLKAYDEPDDDNWEAAEALSDLYSCHTCVMHIAQVYIKGIMTGYEDGAFHHSNTLTRAEAAAVVMRLINPDLRTDISDTGDIQDLISPEQAFEMIENGAVLIDVRPGDEYASGHIGGSISIPITDIEENAEAALAGIDTDSVIIVYCTRGTKSRNAVRILTGAGYQNVYNLGGIEGREYDLESD